MRSLYLDNAATTPLAPEVREAMLPYLGEAWGNPSSRHRLGVEAVEAIDAARDAVARALAVRPDGVVFTSGGTEANNLAVLGFARARAARGRRVVVGASEHPSVRDSARALAEEGFEVAEAPLAPGGGLDLDALAELLDERTVLVALMLVNNEVGTRHAIERAAPLVRARAPRAALHVDAVQALGKVVVSPGELGCDSLAISAHKIHGPKGSGALVLAGSARPRPLLFGGGQEGGIRSGTENVAGIVGLGAAVERAVAAQPETEPHLERLAERFVAGLAAFEGIEPLPAGRGEERAPHVLPILVPGAPAEVWQHHLEARGVLVGVGSACHSRRKGESPTLLARGLSGDEARQVLRVSFASTTTEDEVAAALDALGEVARSLAARIA